MTSHKCDCPKEEDHGLQASAAKQRIDAQAGGIPPAVAEFAVEERQFLLDHIAEQAAYIEQQDDAYALLSLDAGRKMDEQAREIDTLANVCAQLRMQAQIQAQEARTQKAIVAEIGSMVGEPMDFLTAGAVRAALKAQLQALEPCKCPGLFCAKGGAPAERGAIPSELIEALKFYAEGAHFVMHELVWDTVSGEPANFYEDENNTATVEDGSIAKAALARLNPAPATADSDVREVKE